MKTLEGTSLPEEEAHSMISLTIMLKKEIQYLPHQTWQHMQRPFMSRGVEKAVPSYFV